jgi:cell wall-associated NlpC family hydrolase
VGLAAPSAPQAPFAASAPFTAVPSPDAPVAFAAPAAPAVAAPAAGSAPFATGSFAVAGSMPEAGHGTKAAQAVAFARAQTGKPCVWGAAGPGSYDAPGLTQAAWKAAGVVLPRTAEEQAAMGTPVSLTALLPGDLVFFHDTVSHVGICTGDGMMVHAPGPGAYIREEPIHEAVRSAIHGAVRPA